MNGRFAIQNATGPLALGNLGEFSRRLVNARGKSTMEIYQLRYFLAIAQTSNIAEASKKLHVSQSSMSVALSSLERELGFDLFDRNGRRLSINANGIYFAEQVRAAFATVNDAQASIANDLAKRQSSVLCSTDLTLGQVAVVLISEFRKAHPEVVLHFAFHEGNTFKRKSPDIEFRGTSKELEENERCIKIAHENFVAVFQEGRFDDSAGAIPLEQLRNEPYILPGPGEMQNTMRSIFEEAGFAPNVVSELQLHHEILNLVRKGVGFTIAPELTWLGDAEGLSARPIKETTKGRNIYAVMPERSVPSGSTLLFMEFLRSNAKRLLM
jgi:LysR family transcriptional regulator, transcription activator of glutamate synthase operon